MALLHPHRADYLEKAILACLAREPRQLLERSGDDVTDAVATVQGGVGVLEDDLHRLQLLVAARGAFGRERQAIQFDHRSLVGHGEPEQDAGEGRLAAPRLADQSERLSCLQIEVDADDGTDVFAADMEGLRHAPQADHRVPSALGVSLLDVDRGCSRELGRLLVVVTARGAFGAHLIRRVASPRRNALRKRTALGEHASDLDFPGPGRKPGMASRRPWSLR